MELNKRVLQEEGQIPLAGTEDDEMEKLSGEDISVIDNGFSRLNRAFFNAAYATKEVGQSSEHKEDNHNKSMKRAADRFLEQAIEQMIDRAQQQMLQRIQEMEGFLDDLRSRRAALDGRQSEIATLLFSTFEEQHELQQEKEEILLEQEKTLEEKRESDEKVAHAQSEVERCAEEKNITSCAAQYAPEALANNVQGAALHKAVNERTGEILSQAIANQSYVADKLSSIDTHLTSLNDRLDVLAQKIETLQNEAEQNAEEMQELDQQREQLEQDLAEAKQQAQEFSDKMSDPAFRQRVEAGEVSQSELQAMMPEFIRDQEAAPVPAQPQTSVVAATFPSYFTSVAELTADLAAGRPTGSVSASLDDGGGIKGAKSIQVPFAAAASGVTPAETAPELTSPVMEQKQQMAVGGMAMG